MNDRMKRRKRKYISILIVSSFVVFICAIAIIKTVDKKNVRVGAEKSIKLKNSKNPKKAMDKRESSLPPKSVNEAKGVISSGEYMPWNEKPTNGQKIAYLTFDDGPSLNNTPQILSLLKQNKINATFFLIGKNAEKYPSLVKEEVADGDAIGNHTYSHTLNYKEGPNGFVEDVNKCDEILKSIVGDKYDSKLLRFPGGSWDSKYLKLGAFRNAIASAGYHFVNWNDLNGDAEHGLTPANDLYERVIKETGNKQVVVILMHDAAAKTTTVKALPNIIKYLKDKEYTFETLK
ncbi:polysaccharide deacetylase family protein [Clostridium hydrogenum]|uniref:polysaccharide deacetylase family protein n=1 Tax=Clostridium hydrogenum TaxID=2855764 RepID=UPI001F3FDBF8|nr:polysaccharide deacetylase family protein [Clostridium hydrogenum]